MGIEKSVRELLDRAESLGWTIGEEHDVLEFRHSSPAGEDFSFCICTFDVHTGLDLEREVRLYADDFDTEEHVAMWLEAKNSGTGGVPDLKTLVKDADDIELMLIELELAFERELNGSDDDAEAELSMSQLERLDDIDNAMYAFLQVLLEKDDKEFPWNIQYIGEAVDAVVDVMYGHGFNIRRPCIIDDGVVAPYVSEGEYHTDGGADNA